MSAPSRRERWSYRFDTWMSKGTGALIGLLGAATFVFVAFVALIVWALPLHPEGEEEAGFLDIFWGNLMRTLDPGTMGGDRGWGFRIAMLVVTIGGLIIVASLIGIVSGGFDAKVVELRKGRSRVIENGHTLILGWSDKVFSIIQELAIANESRGRSVIVVLAPRDKVEMEDAIRARVGSTSKTVVVCRTGEPMELADLALGSPHTARSIILVSPEGEADPDAAVIKTALAVVHGPGRRAELNHVVAELDDASNLEAARLVGGEEVDWLLAGELISRIIVQTSRQSGLSVVYSELLSFSGAEIYLTERPELIGLDYRQLLASFPDSSVIGLLQNGDPRLNPPSDTVYRSGDQLIVIAEDDSLIRTSLRDPAPPLERLAANASAESPERTLVFGVSPSLPSFLSELDEYVVPGSSVMIVADAAAPELPEMTNLRVEFRSGDPTSRAVLENAGVPDSDHIVVLADSSAGLQRADARTLITLLHLRDMARRVGTSLNVVSEMFDDRNRELAEITDADDFIVSDRIVALTLSQLSEDRRLGAVLRELISPRGSEIYLRDASEYVDADQEVDFFEIVEAAQRRGESAIGFRVAALSRQSSRNHGVVLNPVKSESRRFAPGDRVIVLAER